MNEQQMERLAEQTRQRMLKIWDGNAQDADAFLCVIMRYFKDAALAYGISESDAQRVINRLAQLIQR